MGISQGYWIIYALIEEIYHELSLAPTLTELTILAYLRKTDNNEKTIPSSKREPLKM
jgi:hypothetical protein